MKNILNIIVLCLAVIVTGCTRFVPVVYKIDVEQGNIITQKDVNKIKVGMSRKQIRYALGTPLIADSFHKARWDYIFTSKKGYKKPTRKQISIHFKNDVVTKIEGDIQPQKQSAVKVKPETTVVVINPKEKRKGIFKRIFTGANEAEKIERKRLKREKKLKKKKEKAAEKAKEKEKAAKKGYKPT